MADKTNKLVVFSLYALLPLGWLGLSVAVPVVGLLGNLLLAVAGFAFVGSADFRASVWRTLRRDPPQKEPTGKAGALVALAVVCFIGAVVGWARSGSHQAASTPSVQSAKEVPGAKQAPSGSTSPTSSASSSDRATPTTARPPDPKALARAVKVSVAYEQAAAKRPGRDNYAFVAKRLGKSKDEVVEAVSLVAEYRAGLEEEMVTLNRRVGGGINIEVEKMASTKLGPHTAVLTIEVIGCPDTERARVGVTNLLNEALSKLAMEVPEGVTGYRAQSRYRTGSCGSGKPGPVFLWSRKTNKVTQE